MIFFFTIRYRQEEASGQALSDNTCPQEVPPFPSSHSLGTMVLTEPANSSFATPEKPLLAPNLEVQKEAVF